MGYGYKSSKLITLADVVAEAQGPAGRRSPHHSETGDILPGVDHPFRVPDDVAKIPGGDHRARWS
jgi:hypothetical protein